MFGEFDRAVGIEYLRAFHLNDSRHVLGSRRDRHAVPGQGEIGLAGFRLLMQDSRFVDHPGITELTDELTPGALSFLGGLRKR